MTIAIALEQVDLVAQIKNNFYLFSRLGDHIVLPECTYINDCKVVNLSEDQQFIVENRL